MSSPVANTTRGSFREIYLETDADTFDLHNCFNFISVTYDPATQVVRLRWEPDQYASPEQRRSLVVELRGVTHLSATPRDTELPFSEDTCLAAVGGVRPSEPTLEDISSEVPLGWHHVFTFMSGLVLRIGAESVCLLPNDI
jgi:hypothetical protein